MTEKRFGEEAGTIRKNKRKNRISIYHSEDYIKEYVMLEIVIYIIEMGDILRKSGSIYNIKTIIFVRNELILI